MEIVYGRALFSKRALEECRTRLIQINTVGNACYARIDDVSDILNGVVVVHLADQANVPHD